MAFNMRQTRREDRMIETRLRVYHETLKAAELEGHGEEAAKKIAWDKAYNLRFTKAGTIRKGAPR